MNRNRPLKQARILATLLLCSSMYIYFLFASPQQSQQYVLELNTKESMRYYQHLHEHSLLLQERRHELAVKQHEARVRRNQARNATLLQKKSYNNSTTHYTRDEESQQHAVHRILGMLLSLFASVCMCASAQFLHRLCNGGGTILLLQQQQQHHEHRLVDKNVKIDFANGHDN